MINISIVMATYNGGRFLREQLDSLYRQSYKPDEVVVVDDCSTDNTIDILKEYHKTYGLRYIQNEKNLGVNANFEKALKETKGAYIMFCDQDDFWLPNKIEKMYAKMKEIEIAGPCVVSSRDTYADVNLVPNPKLNFYNNTTFIKRDSTDYRTTINLHLSQGSALLLNRNCLEYIFPFPDSSTDVCYDFYVGYIVAMVGLKYDMKESLMYYRVHDNNVTASDTAVKESYQLKKKRSLSVVPHHYLDTFRIANKAIGSKIPHDRRNYVEKILKLSEDINLIRRLKLLLTTPGIPFKLRIRNIARYMANKIFNY